MPDAGRPRPGCPRGRGRRRVMDDLRDPDGYDPDQWETSACRPEVHAWIPFTDTASRIILENTILDLVAHRGGEYGDAGARLSVLVSLLAEGEAWLPELVADARAQCYAWSAVADRLATTVSVARHRYAAYAIWRRRDQ